MANDDLILKLDNQDIVLEDDSSIDIILVDSLPHSQHYYDYEGEYSVVPIVNDSTILLSKERLMHENVVVEPIPITYTDNEYGGVTVTIG